MGIKINQSDQKQKKIPEEFKDLAKDFAEKGFITTSSSSETQGLDGSGSLEATVTLQEKPSMVIPVSFKLFTLQRGYELENNSIWLNQLKWRLHHDDDLYASVSKSHTDISILVTDEIRLSSESESQSVSESRSLSESQSMSDSISLSFSPDNSLSESECPELVIRIESFSFIHSDFDG